MVFLYTSFFWSLFVSLCVCSIGLFPDSAGTQLEGGREAGRGDTKTDRQREGGWDESLGLDDEERKGERESLY
jgi:hypothetical protein